MRKILLIVMLLFTGFASAIAQTRQVTGKVTQSENNAAIASATVTVKGTGQVTATNAEGSFSINVTDKNDLTLIISSVGFKTTEVRVGNRASLAVVLETSATELEEVVAIGYATVRRRDLTGSVSSVSAKQLADVPVNSAAEALAGRLAGVQVTAAEGSPDAEISIRVRGGTSINLDNTPLYIVDGVQIENGLAGLSPQDIQSIDVLKDAASTAIYGARGSNGVVIITTKGGRESRTTINYNNSFGTSDLTKKLDVLSPYEFVVYQFERGRRDYGTYFDTLENYKSLEPIDWQERIMGNQAFRQNHNLSIGGGSKTTQFNLSLTSNKQEAIVRNSDYDRKIITFRFDHTASSKLKVGFNMRYTQQSVLGSGVSDEGGTSFNLLRHSVKAPPFNRNPLLDDEEYDDELYAASSQGDGLGIINPVAVSDATYKNRIQKFTTYSGYFDYKISKSFSFKSTIGVNMNVSQNNTFYDFITSKSKSQGAALPMAGVQTNNSSSLNNSNVLSYTNASSSKHQINVLAGNELLNFKGSSINNQLRYFPLGMTAEKALDMLSLGESIPLYPQTEKNENRLVSYFSRANYAYDGKYLASFTLRADGSSKFAADKRWGYFPSGSVAWRLSRENFFKNIAAVADVKVRGSYGIAGNNRIADYSYLNVYETGASYGLNGSLVTAYTVPVLANKDLKWENTVSKNIGIDIGLLRGRIQFSADVYRNSTSDLLVYAPIPSSSGYAIQAQNVGATTNEGIELQLNAVLIQKKRFRWNADFNIAFNKNEIESLSRTEGTDFYLQRSGFGTSGTTGDFLVQVGKPVGLMYGFISDGFYTVDDFDYDVATRRYTMKKGVVDNQANGTMMPGQIRHKDINGDGIVNADDRTVIGNANPKFIGGWNNQFTFLNFDMSVFLNFSYGNDVFNANTVEFNNGYTNHTNLIGYMKDRWKTIDETGKVIQSVTSGIVTGEAPEILKEVNKNAKYWVPLYSTSAPFTLASYAVEDGSFLRVNNITLGYTLPVRLTKKARIQRLRIYATGNNLHVFTSYSGYDPEVSTRRATPVTPGVDMSAYPRSRTYFVGLNLSL